MNNVKIGQWVHYKKFDAIRKLKVIQVDVHIEDQTYVVILNPNTLVSMMVNVNEIDANITIVDGDWPPDEGIQVFCVDEFGQLSSLPYSTLCASSEVYKSQLEAHNAYCVRQAMYALQQYANNVNGNWSPDYDKIESKHIIVRDYDSRTVDDPYYIRLLPGRRTKQMNQVVFRNADDAKIAIEIMKSELDIIFGVE